MDAAEPAYDGDDLETFEDALLEGDVAYQRGTAQAALRHRNFRIVYFGAFSSNVGTWMQNVILVAFAFKLSGGAFASLIFFAQLGPLLFLSLWGGVLADVVDRRRFLVSAQIAQGLLSFGLAALAFSSNPSRVGLVAIVFAIGIANAIGAPGLSAILPTLVPREDLNGAVALMSVQMNLSRVIGPVIGAFVYASFRAGWVFAINAVTYAFAVIGLLWAAYPRRVNARIEEQGIARVLSGVRIVRRDALLSYVILTLFSFSLLSLPFVGIMPQIAQHNLGINPKSWQYGLFYACFGIGAALGAATVGTVLAARDKAALLRPGFFAFAVVLTGFAAVSQRAFAYPVIAVLGYVYFVIITCLSTVLQEHVPEHQRGRVMALWIMGFGGTVPVGVLVAGPFSDHYVRGILVVGAVWAVVLGLWSNANTLHRKATAHD
ncbi:MAG TPA: MFS transporter [Acidimicrobiia bacterium]|nr:MFS transporter [Acidimicrobiia bacterium]